MPGFTNLDMDALRSFVCGVDAGSFTTAADLVGRSRAAVSGQLRKLERQAGGRLMRRSGRGLVPTPTGEALLSYARRILALNDRALAVIQEARLGDTVRLGVPPDLAESWLPTLLASFAARRPGTRVGVRSDRSSELTRRVATGELDVALAWEHGTVAGQTLAEVPVDWLVRADGDMQVTRTRPLSLVAFDEPCLFRRIGLAALDDADIDCRVGFTSPDLSGLWAAVAAGIGITMRTRIGLPASIAVAEPGCVDLPELPPVTLSLHRAGPLDAPAAALSDLAVEYAAELR